MNAEEMAALDRHMRRLGLSETGHIDFDYHVRRGRSLQARALRRGFAAFGRGLVKTLDAAVRWSLPRARGAADWIGHSPRMSRH